LGDRGPRTVEVAEREKGAVEASGEGTDRDSLARHGRECVFTLTSNRELPAGVRNFPRTHDVRPRLALIGAGAVRGGDERMQSALGTPVGALQSAIRLSRFQAAFLKLQPECSGVKASRFRRDAAFAIDEGTPELGALSFEKQGERDFQAADGDGSIPS